MDTAKHNVFKYIAVGTCYLLFLCLMLYWSALLIMGPAKLHHWLGPETIDAVHIVIISVILISLIILLYLLPLIIGLIIAKQIRKCMPTYLRVIMLAVPIIVISVATLYNVVRYHYRFGDALNRALFYSSNTEWASEYSETLFSEIKPGMTRMEVVIHIGEPLEKSNTGSHWIYTRQIDKSKNYDYRVVIFNQNGKVTKAYRSYYLD